MRGTVSFVGAGPGAADLLTLRGAKRIADADLVLYASGVTDPTWLREHTGPDAELIDCARLGPDEIAEHYRRLASRRGTAVRLVSGDPALSPRLREQLDLCARLGLDVEVVPGVSPISATGTALLEAGAIDSVSITTVETDFAPIRALAAVDRTLAVRAPAARTADLVEALSAAGVPDDTPAVVADKVSRPDETIIHTTVADLVAEVKKHNLWRTTLFLIGDTLRTTGKPRTDDPAPRWTARSWRRPTDEPRKTWAERRAEAAEPVREEPEPASTARLSGRNGAAEKVRAGRWTQGASAARSSGRGGGGEASEQEPAARWAAHGASAGRLSGRDSAAGKASEQTRAGRWAAKGDSGAGLSRSGAVGTASEQEPAAGDGSAGRNGVAGKASEQGLGRGSAAQGASAGRNGGAGKASGQGVGGRWAAQGGSGAGLSAQNGSAGTVSAPGGSGEGVSGQGEGSAAAGAAGGGSGQGGSGGGLSGRSGVSAQGAAGGAGAQGGAADRSSGQGAEEKASGRQGDLQGAGASAEERVVGGGGVGEAGVGGLGIGDAGAGGVGVGKAEVGVGEAAGDAGSRGAKAVRGQGKRTARAGAKRGVKKS
ncbi:cobalt-precorrin-4/precorrin-4 C(11)-methyltransferase [Actinokineospora sp. UTMC 2448]|uniref:cobalt-precorrin-4/precorrin-4 C(11)-methyltransferase n=1 Tax=Actinokineospora sp. UTMC 2448 TaxID=2268449 RepID=UPI0022092C31|nr:SAM-dependent methyltransferase [Actinokineospora sp. UTMC 2448]UVS81077.1 Cobalt-precorrin-4 C(11)-methyltransferase [Actinokineospora sp. UTMC 2448]